MHTKIRKLVISHVERLRPINFDKNDHLLYRINIISSTARQDNYLAFRRALTSLERKKVYNEVRDGLNFHALNQTLNNIFSDAGWAEIRKKISQINKRENIKRIPISNAIYRELVQYKERNKLSSFDEAIELLLEQAEVDCVEESSNDE